MTSLTQIAYGSRVRRQGRSRRLARYHSSSCFRIRATSSSADGIDGLFPVFPVERSHAEARQHFPVETAHVHVDLIRMRTRRVEGLDPAAPAEAMLGDAGVELVDDELGFSAQKLEILGVHDQM